MSDKRLKQNPFGDMEVIIDGALHFVAHDGCCMRCGARSHPNSSPPATRQALADALDAANERAELVRAAYEAVADAVYECLGSEPGRTVIGRMPTQEDLYTLYNVVRHADRVLPKEVAKRG